MNRSISRILQSALLLIAIGFWSSPALAFFGCNVTANNVAFGTYNPMSGAAVNSVGSVRFACFNIFEPPRTVNFTIQLSTGGSGTYSPRQLSSGANTLGYNLYTSPAHISVWGDGSGGSVTQSGTFNLSGFAFQDQVFSTYGRIPGSQNVPAGSYSDTITATVLF